MSDAIADLVSFSNQLLSQTDPDRILSQTDSKWEVPVSWTGDIKRLATAARGVELCDALAVKELTGLIDEWILVCDGRVNEAQDYLARVRANTMTPTVEQIWKELSAFNISGMYEIHSRLRNLSQLLLAARQAERKEKGRNTPPPKKALRKKGDKIALACELKSRPGYWDCSRKQIAELVGCDVTLLSNDRYRAVEIESERKARAARARKSTN